MSSRRASMNCRCGFTLIEAAMGSIVVAILLGAGLTAVTQATKARKIAEERMLARAFAQQIIEEVASKGYDDPQDPSQPLGLNAGEVAGNRLTYDDIDDYHGLTISPISLPSGDVLSDSTWEAVVRVVWVQSSDFSATRAAETGLKRVTVEISKGAKHVLTTKVLRSSAWEDVQ